FALFIIIYTKKLSAQNSIWYKWAKVIILTSIILTFSRGTFLALIIGFFYYKGFFSLLARNSLKIFKWGVLILITSFVIRVSIPLSYERIQKVIHNKTNIEYLLDNARFRIWKYHIASFEDHLLLGEGLSRSREEFIPEIHPPRYSGSHNTPINLVNYMGLTGFSLMIFFFGTIFFILRRKSKIFPLQRSFFRLGETMIISLFIFGLFEHSFIKLFFWGIIVLCLMIALYNPKNNNISIKCNID
ncbi:MAG: O-antigen ligase family protein, partial [Nanoarchaeota archaeon]